MCIRDSPKTRQVILIDKSRHPPLLHSQAPAFVADPLVTAEMQTAVPVRADQNIVD